MSIGCNLYKEVFNQGLMGSIPRSARMQRETDPIFIDKEMILKITDNSNKLWLICM